HSQTLLAWIETRTLWNCPGAKNTFHLESKIVMHACGVMFLNDETVTRTLLYLAGRLRCFVESAFPFVFFESHSEIYNSYMGRMRIKKKEAVVPLRETMAYRMILIGISLAVFMTALYLLVSSISTNRNLAIASGVIGAAATIGIFYNLDQLRFA